MRHGTLHGPFGSTCLCGPRATVCECPGFEDTCECLSWTLDQSTGDRYCTECYTTEESDA